MRHKTLRLCAILLLGLGLTGLQAQESVNAAGGNAAGNGGTANYTVGQTGYHTYEGTNGSVAEGVQQPYEISIVTAIEGTDEITLSVSVYPNPTADYLTLSMYDEVTTDNDLSQYSYQLLDMHGKLLQDVRITEAQTSINMSNLLPAAYLLKVVSRSKEVKTFKVVKR